MLYIPPNQTNLKWYEQSQYRQWIEQLFAITSQRLNYTLHLEHGKHQAYVILESRTLFINAGLPGFNHKTDQIIRFDPVSEETRKNLIIKALTTHEAGHVLYTRLERQLSHKAQWIWNAIEDERIERLLRQEYPELNAAFTYINELNYFNQLPELDGSILEGILMWRFSKDSMRPWRPAPEQQELWKDIRPLVEAGWNAKDAEQVAFIAQMIEQLLKEEGQSGQTPPQQGQGQSPQDQNSQSQSSQPQPNNTQSDNSQAGAGSSDDQSPENSENPEGKEAEENGNKTSNAGQPDPDKPEAASEESQSQTQEQKSANDAKGNKEDSSSEQSSPCDEVPERLKSQVSASGSNAPEQTQEEKAAQLQEPTNDLSGGSVGTRKLPEPTQAQSGSQLPLQEVESYARQIAPLLKPREEKSIPLSHKSRGRYNYSRHSSGYEKYFDHKEIPHAPSPIFIDMLLDQSSSMNGKRMQAAKQVAYLIIRAALFAQSGYRITTFNHTYSELCTQKTGYEVARGKITQLYATGNTLLSPPLEHVLKNPPKDALHFIIIICDGQLDKIDSNKCKNLIHNDRKTPKRILPLLIGEATNKKSEWENIFGAAQAFEDMDDMAKYIKSILTSYRQKSPKRAS